ncbi:GldG family protein [Myxococcota bacterium]|nr:GldG family protein [Myxococcota bacterium]
MRSWSWILGFLGGLGVLAFLAYAAFVDRVETPYAVAGGAALALVIAWVALDRQALQQALTARGARYSATASLLVLVVGAIAVALNVLAARYDERLDLTSSQRFSLSAQTDEVLAGLAQEIEVLAFFPAGSAEESTFKDLVEGYESRSPLVEVHFHDPLREPFVAEQHQVTSSWGTVIVRPAQSEGQAVAAFGAPDGGSQRLESDFGEEALTNAIIRATSGERHQVCAVSGHGELDPEDSQDATGLGVAVGRLTAQNYTLRSFNLVREGGVPEDCGLVLVADPQTDLLAAELEHLAAWVAGGGSMLVLLDPTHAPGFAADLDRYGLRVGQDIVVEENPKYQLVGGDPTYLVLDRESLPPHPLTEDVTGMAVLRVARSVGIGSAVPGVEVQVLARTTPYGWAETTLDGMTAPAPDDGDIVGNVPLAALAEVTDPTGLRVGSRALGEPGPAGVLPLPAAPAEPAAPPVEAAPAEPAAPPVEAAPAEPAAPPVELPRKAGGKVLVFGDSDFAANELLAQGNNQDLFLNAVAWLVGEEDQVSIRPNAAASASLSMNLLQGLGVWLLCLLVVPGTAIGMALATWRKRRSL